MPLGISFLDTFHFLIHFVPNLKSGSTWCKFHVWMCGGSFFQDLYCDKQKMVKFCTDCFRRVFCANFISYQQREINDGWEFHKCTEGSNQDR